MIKIFSENRTEIFLGLNREVLKPEGTNCKKQLLLLQNQTEAEVYLYD